MSIDTHRGLKHLFKIALLSATFFMFGATAIATTANADEPADMNRAVYNGTQPPERDFVTNVSGGQEQPNQYFTSWISLDNQDSNYVSPTGNVVQGTNSILNLDSYIQKPDSLYEHILLKNESDSPMSFYISFGLPQFYRSTETPNSNLPVYGKEGPVSPTSDSATQGVSVLYARKSADTTPAANTGSWTASDWQGVTAIHVSNTLKNKGDQYRLDVPLKLLDPKNVDVYGNNSSFKLTTANWSDFQYHNANMRFARVADANKQFGINGTNKYLVTYRTPDLKYFHATDIQNLMPVIQAKDTVINDFDATYDPTKNDFPYFYTGGYFYLNYQDLKDVNGNNLVQTLQDNGYGAPAYANGNFLPRYVWSPTKKDDSGSTGGSEWMNQNGIGALQIQIVKVIDVNGINDQDQLILNPGAKWNPADNVKIWDPQQMSQAKVLTDAKPNITSTRPLNADGTVNTSQTGSFDITYSYPFSYANGNKVTFKKTIHVIVGNNSGGGTTTTPSDTTSSSSSSTTNGSSSSTGSSSSSTPTTTTKPSTSVGPNIAVKGEAVYATKKIGLYKNTKFTKANRVAWYPKQKRVNRPMFVVTGYKRAANGALRYKVRDVNHGRKTAGKKGYITASRKYVVPVYYASVPKSKKITVISRKGVNTYKSANLTGKAKHYKKGTRLTVKKLVKHNLTTRYQLSNGHFVTANKKLVIAGNY